MRHLHVDCASGISGDMFLGALLDAGADEKALREGLARLKLDDEFELVVNRKSSYGISGTDVQVDLLELDDDTIHRKSHEESLEHEHEHSHPHGHDHHGHEQGHDHGHEHVHAHKHAHGDGHDHENHAHGHGHDGHAHGRGVRRNLPAILKRLNDSGLAQNIVDHAAHIFGRLAKAEAKVHGVPVDRVHFHEVGAVDAMVDIVGACILLDNLGITSISASAIATGSGTVRCEHGVLPVPAPATAELLIGLPVYSGHIQKELTTPTGAAIISSIAQSVGDMPRMTVSVCGYGVGKRDMGQPNVLRVMVGEKGSAERGVLLLETNIDDMTAEELGFLMDKLFDIGALDVWFTHIQMKKNRPAVMVSVLCDDHMQAQMEETVFKHSTTLGIRRRAVERRTLARGSVMVATPYGQVRVKFSEVDGRMRYAPEYDDCKRLALEKDISLKQVMEAAGREAEQQNL